MATTKTAESSSKKTTTAKKAAPKSVVPKTTPSATAKPATTRKKTVKTPIITSDERYRMIEVSAYYIAEKSGFGDNHLDYWLAAEKEVDNQLNA